MGKITRIVSASLLAATTGTLGFNWSKWITPLVEPEYVLSDSVQRVQLTPGGDGLRERVVSWVSGSDRSGDSLRLFCGDSLLFGSEPSHHEIRTHGGVTHVQSVAIPSLESGRYPYTITSGDGVEAYRDTLVIPSDTLQTFVLIGDVQDTWGDDTRPLMDSLYRVHPDAAAWIQVGDLIERPHDQYWRRYYDAFASVAPRIPLITVIGDHENEAGLMYDVDDRWEYVLDYPDNGPEERVGHAYYIDYPDMRVVCYDSNSLFWSIGTQRPWLERVLRERRDHPFLVVCAHHPVYSGTKNRFNPLNNTLLGPLFRRCGVDLVLAGHDHIFVHDRDPDGGGPHYIGLSTAHKTYSVQEPERHVASESGARYYGIMTVTPEALRVAVYREGGTLLDSLCVSRKGLR